MTRGLKALTPLVTLAVVVGIAIGAIVAYANRASAEPATSTEYAQYTNARWHYSLAIPSDMTATEFDRERGGQTVEFMEPSGDHDLLISAWPYSQLDVTLGEEGTPSTTSDQPDHLEIVDVVRDDTITVLFQKNGVRYYVVTLGDDEAWLTDLLTTWRFTD